MAREPALAGHVDILDPRQALGGAKLADVPVDLCVTPGEAAKHPPVADIATRSATDAKYFEGSLWLMAMGSWVVHIYASGPAGDGDMAVPVPAVAIRRRPQSRSTSRLPARSSASIRSH